MNFDQRVGEIWDHHRGASPGLVEAPSTLCALAAAYNTARMTAHPAFGNFQFDVYSRVLTLTSMYDTGPHEGRYDWALPYEDYLAQFRAVVSDEHKEFLREMFQDEPPPLVSPRSGQHKFSDGVGWLACPSISTNATA